MPSHCAAFACRNRRGKCPDNVTFHRFPKDDNLRLQWAKALNRVKKKGNLWLPGRGNYLCSAHFKPEDFDRTGQTTRLRPNTVPSVCMLPPHLEKKTPPQRTTLNSTIGKQQADDVTSTSSRSDQTLANTRASVALDHAYQLPDAADLKSRLEKANLKRQHLEKELKNTRQRENRVRCSSKVLFDELKEKNLISEEFKAKLESFAGRSLNVTSFMHIT